MSRTSGRLLSLLSLLQARRDWPGQVLAHRLQVSARTVRRDVDRLRELGYPVQATMGPDGAPPSPASTPTSRFSGRPSWCTPSRRWPAAAPRPPSPGPPPPCTAAPGQPREPLVRAVSTPERRPRSWRPLRGGPARWTHGDRDMSCVHPVSLRGCHVPSDLDPRRPGRRPRRPPHSGRREWAVADQVPARRPGAAGEAGPALARQRRSGAHCASPGQDRGGPSDDPHRPARGSGRVKVIDAGVVVELVAGSLDSGRLEDASGQDRVRTSVRAAADRRRSGGVRCAGPGRPGRRCPPRAGRRTPRAWRGTGRAAAGRAGAIRPRAGGRPTARG